ncbi:hypothetical protein JZ751_009435 [Albula glossodonta]|uniref:Uncharacterized protein n=1 Tax=Albula glossodonta TaxID=121402 RepID=A0A8T2N5R4_9TELE|nr:hypothetical protein JZ751_009435 [Albula glossodonta]
MKDLHKTNIREQNSLDIRQHSALSNGDSSQELVQLFVVAHRQLQRYQPILGSQRLGTREQRLDTLELQHQHVRHSFLCAGACERDPLETEVQLWMSES